MADLKPDDATTLPGDVNTEPDEANSSTAEANVATGAANVMQLKHSGSATISAISAEVKLAVPPRWRAASRSNLGTGASSRSHGDIRVGNRGIRSVSSRSNEVPGSSTSIQRQASSVQRDKPSQKSKERLGPWKATSDPVGSVDSLEPRLLQSGGPQSGSIQLPGIRLDKSVSGNRNGQSLMNSKIADQPFEVLKQGTVRVAMYQLVESKPFFYGIHVSLFVNSFLLALLTRPEIRVAVGKFELVHSLNIGLHSQPRVKSLESACKSRCAISICIETCLNGLSFTGIIFAFLLSDLYQNVQHIDNGIKMISNGLILIYNGFHRLVLISNLASRFWIN